MNVLTLENISKSYYSAVSEPVHALRDISLRFDAGAFVVFVGSNGSGKTTLLNILAGAESADSGSISLAGKDITAMPEFRRASMIGRVFQNPFRGTVADMTVEENIALAACRGERFNLRSALNSSLRDEIHQRLSSLGIGLETRMKQPIASLSGGQRQVITMLMATWRRPGLLLLDEHTAALDPQSAALVLRITARIVEQGDITVLMVTHSMQQAVQYGQRLIMMHRGSVALDIAGNEKRRAQPAELIQRFDELRRSELIDGHVAKLLKEQYV